MDASQIIKFLESRSGISLVSDDGGHWAVTGAGFQNVPESFPDDLTTTFLIEKDQWKKSIKEAVEAYANEIET